MPKQKLEYFQNFEIIYSFKNYILIDLKSTSKSNLNENLALLLTTSGSTGSPKFVRLSYKNLSSNAESIIDYLKISKKDRPITTLPMSYSFGLSIINSHLIAGAKILVTSKSLMEKSFWDFFRMSKATSMSGVPFTFEILKKLRFFRMETPYLKTLTQAGGKLNVDLLKEYADFCKLNNKDFYVMYGQTEATARISYVPPEKLLSKIGSIGLSIPGGNLSIVDENMQCIDDANIVGEIKYSGPNVSMGYASSQMDLIKGDDNFGELLTGDLAKKDEDNFYFIVGRKKRFIKIFGNRINLDEVEQILKPAFGEVACVGQDDKMIIYLTDESEIKNIKTLLREMIGINKTAYQIKTLRNIPKNNSGKILYSELRSMNIDEYLKKDPYSLNKIEKSNFLNEYLHFLHDHHYTSSENYKKIIDSIKFSFNESKFNYKKLPFLPVRLFKMHSLKSIHDGDVVKTMTSSGTSGQQVSKIYLDKETSLNQTKAMTRIVSDFIGTKRAPMIIIDSLSVLKIYICFLQEAGILGFSMFASKNICFG